MALDETTLKRIKTLHPKIRKEVLEAYTHINEKLLGKNVRLRLTHTFRTFEEQDKLFNQRPKVTNAKGGQSIHNYGLAFDMVILYDLDKNGTFEKVSWDMLKDFDQDGQSDWMEAVNYFKSQGFTWGGDWKSFKDNPHFQKDFGVSWQQMKAKIDKGDYCSEVIGGISYKYCNV